MQIYAIFLQKTGVGRGSTGKNPVKMEIAMWILGIIGALKKEPVAKLAVLLGNLKILKSKKSASRLTWWPYAGSLGVGGPALPDGRSGRLDPTSRWLRPQHQTQLLLDIALDFRLGHKRRQQPWQLRIHRDQVIRHLHCPGDVHAEETLFRRER